MYISGTWKCRCESASLQVNIKFLIKTGRWRNIPRTNRLCSKCTTGTIGDEFYYSLICQCKVVEIRNKFILNYYTNNSNENKMIGLFKLCHTELLTNVSLLIRKMSVLFRICILTILHVFMIVLTFVVFYYM